MTVPDSVTEIGSDAFYDCRGLTSVTIPDSVTEIGSYTFFGCSGLTSVVIPDSVTEIGEYAFYRSGLTSVVIPNSVTEIEVGVFEDCKGLTSVVIPNSVTKIGVWAFRGCSSLTSVIIPNSITKIGKWAFEDCSNLSLIKSEITEPFAIDCVFDDEVMARATLYVPAGTTSKYQATEGWKKFVNIVEDSEVVKQPDASEETSKQTSVASTTTETVSIPNSAANDQEVEINIAKPQEVYASSEEDSVVNSEASEQKATSDITEPQMDDKNYFSKTVDFGEYGTVEFVDLGLSSGTLWSTINLGAQHFCHGEYEGGWANPDWLPTYEQCKELIDECHFAVAYLQEGNNSFVCVSVTGPNGNVIYLPLFYSEEFGGLAFDCWTSRTVDDSMAAFMLIQTTLQTEFLYREFFELSKITIGVSQKGVNRSWRYVLPK